MPTVKIHELPPKTYPEVKDTNIMVIEDADDTKQIPVSALKLLFSSDDKLNAMNTELTNKLNSFRTELLNMINNLKNEDSDFEARLNNLFEDHEQTKRKLGKIQEDLIDAQNDIIELNEHLTKTDARVSTLESMTSDHEKRIKALESTTADHEKRIKALEADNATNKKNIAQLQQDLHDLSVHVDEEVERLDDRITQSDADRKAYTDKMYDNLMAYIDYYHHVHEYPPNFDEPYIADPIVARYIHPVGTIFETVDPDFEVNKWFPGTWQYCGTGASFDKEINRKVDYYTYRRVE